MNHNTAQKTLYLEDVAQGQVYVSGTLSLSKEELIDFAAKFDPQPMHMDEEAAKNSLFGKLVGSGWQTLNATIRLMVERKPLGETPLIGVQVDDIRFEQPLLPGAVLQAEMEILEVWPSKSKPDRGFVRVEVRTKSNGEPMLSQKWTMLVPTKAGA